MARLNHDADLPVRHLARPLRWRRRLWYIGQWVTRADLLAAAWAALTAIALFAAFYQRAFDDPFITYRYSANLAAGRGFVYNAGERVLSTTTPLYTILLAFVRLAGLDLPLVSNAIGCASIAAGGWALWGLGRTWEVPVMGSAALVLYPIFPLLITTLGAETTFYVALILWGILFYARQRYFAAAAALALAALTRADGILVALVLAVDFLLLRRGPIPWRAVALYSVFGLAWASWSWSYFGSPFPVTLMAKRQQGRLMISQSFLEGAIALVAGYWRQPFYRLHFALAAIGLGALLLRHRRCWLLPGWSLLYFLAYVALGVSRYYWYYAPLVAGTIPVIALGIAALHDLSVRYAGRKAAMLLAVGLVLLAPVPQLQALNRVRQANDQRVAIYQEVGEWLQANTPTSASVGTLEVGIIGYYADRRMIDFAGLIQPETAMQLTPTTTYEDAAVWAVHRFQPNYLVLQDGLFPRLEQDQAVVDACREQARWSDQVYPFQLVLYQCAWGGDRR